jgi:hypothetical protein
MLISYNFFFLCSKKNPIQEIFLLCPFLAPSGLVGSSEKGQKQYAEKRFKQSLNAKQGLKKYPGWLSVAN